MFNLWLSASMLSAASMSLIGDDGRCTVGPLESQVETEHGDFAHAKVKTGWPSEPASHLKNPPQHQPKCVSTLRCVAFSLAFSQLSYSCSSKTRALLAAAAEGCSENNTGHVIRPGPLFPSRCFSDGGAKAFLPRLSRLKKVILFHLYWTQNFFLVKIK